MPTRGEPPLDDDAGPTVALGLALVAQIAAQRQMEPSLWTQERMYWTALSTAAVFVQPPLTKAHKGSAVNIVTSALGVFVLFLFSLLLLFLFGQRLTTLALARQSPLAI